MNYDKNKYRKIDWKHFMMFHWIINPGLLVNELILGQRVPKVMLIEREKGKSWVERSKIPCPHCETVHNGNTWNLKNNTAFKNWFGLYCPFCGGVIPCLMNICTFIVLAITSPIWYWFRKPLYEQWLAKQPQRYQKLDLETQDIRKDNWWKMGLGWGLFMFVAMNGLEVIEGEPLEIKKLIVSLIIWLIGGLLFGLSMRGMIRKVQPKKTKGI